MSELQALEASISSQKDAIIADFKRKAKIEALRYTPSTKTLPKGMGEISNYPSNVNLTATEIKDAAEVIYQWLIKDL